MKQKYGMEKKLKLENFKDFVENALEAPAWLGQMYYSHMLGAYTSNVKIVYYGLFLFNR